MSSVSSDPRPSPSPAFLPLATRHPVCVPPMHTRGRVLQRSWSFPVCQRCFSWNNHRQALEDCRGTAWRLLSPSWHPLPSSRLHNAISYRSFGMWTICPVDLSSWSLTLTKGITYILVPQVPAEFILYQEIFLSHLGLNPAHGEEKTWVNLPVFIFCKNPNGWKDFRVICTCGIG